MSHTRVCLYVCVFAIRISVHVQREQEAKGRSNPSTDRGSAEKTWDTVCQSSLDSSLEAEKKKENNSKNKNT